MDWRGRDWSNAYRYPIIRGEHSDEDFGDQDDNSMSIDNLTGRFLRENVRIMLKTMAQGDNEDDHTQN